MAEVSDDTGEEPGTGTTGGPPTRPLPADETLCLLHAGLPRQAPGSDATTRRLLGLVGPVPLSGRAIDMGCGPGRSALILAAAGLRVLAVDRHEPFLAELRRAADRAGLADRIMTACRSMAEPLAPAGSVDLIWSEGSAYALGFDAALTAWRSLLRPGGTLVVTELEWTTGAPDPATRAFWAAAYPGMRDLAANTAAARRLGYTVVATYALPDADWWTEYYDPLARRLAWLAGAAGSPGRPIDPAVTPDPAALAAEQAEIDLRRMHPADYEYRGFVLRRTGWR